MTGFVLCRVTLHTQEGAEVVGRPQRSPSFTADLRTVGTWKRLHQITGTFRVELAYRDLGGNETWFDRAQPQDLVVIEMRRYDGAAQWHTVFAGFLTEISESVTIGDDGRPQKVVGLSGQDIGKHLSRHALHWWIFHKPIEALAGVQGVTNPTAIVTHATPATLATTYLTQFFLPAIHQDHTINGIPVSYPDLFAYYLEDLDNIIPFDAAFLGGDGSYLSQLQKGYEPNFFELFTDTRRSDDLDQVADWTQAKAGQALGEDGSQAALFARLNPWPEAIGPGAVARDRWDRLPLHEIRGDGDDPYQFSRSRSDTSAFNTFYAWQINGLLDKITQLAVVPILVNATGLKRDGYFPKEVSSRYWADTIEKTVDSIRANTWRVASWNNLNRRFLSGQATVYLHPEIHIGDRVRFTGGALPEPHDFYVEGVHHAFHAQEKASTELTLSRGLPSAEYRQITTFLTDGLTEESIFLNDLQTIVEPGSQPRRVS